MKKQKQSVCPGCSRHCTEDSVRCKYGRTYFSRLREKEEKKCCMQRMECCRKQRHKWEKNATEGSAVWLLLTAARQVKRALKSGEVSEKQVLEAMGAAEAQLREILARLNDRLK